MPRSDRAILIRSIYSIYFKGSPQDGVLKLCEHLGYKPHEYKMGRYANNGTSSFYRRFVAVFDLFANGKMNSFLDIKIVAYIVEYNLHWTSIFQISFPGS